MDIGTYIRDVINKTQGKDPTIDYTDTIEQINAITDKNLLPQKPEISKGSEYERLDYTPPTDEQIEKSAGAVLADYKQAGEQSIENEISALLEKYSTQKRIVSAGFCFDMFCVYITQFERSYGGPQMG